METKEDKQIETFKQLSSAKKLELAFDLYDFARNRVAGEISRQNPQLKMSELEEKIKKRFSHEH